MTTADLEHHEHAPANVDEQPSRATTPADEGHRLDVLADGFLAAVVARPQRGEILLAPREPDPFHDEFFAFFAWADRVFDLPGLDERAKVARRSGISTRNPESK